jgi:hypothetical protein
MNTELTYAVIPAQAGIQQYKYFAQRTTSVFAPRCGNRSINWIPACAGMTGF